MIRVVVDTNVVVSGVLVDEGLPASILDLAANKSILMVISADVLAEYEAVLGRPRFKIAPSRIRQVLSIIRKTSLLVKPTRILSISVMNPIIGFTNAPKPARHCISSLATRSTFPSITRAPAS
jgi:putative PIN family toxin of toxin-antitoxin system